MVRKNPKTKIFQVGFNRTATRSLHKFFKANNIPSVHYAKGFIARELYHQKKKRIPLFTGMDHWQAFTDMEMKEPSGKRKYASEDLFKKMYYQNPDAIFILNIRPIEDWIKSRKNHRDGLYLKQIMDAKRLTEKGVEKMWRKEYLRHVKKVKRFFKKKGNLFIFDISKQNGEDLVKYLSKFGFNCNPEYWNHSHISKKEK